MMILRRLKGLFGAAAIWAVLWIPLGLAAGVYRFWRGGGSDVFGSLPGFLAISAVAYGLWGATTGAAFGLLLMAFVRRHSLTELSIRRMVAWGVLAAMVLPGILLFPSLIEGFALSTLLNSAIPLAIAAGVGGGCGAVTLTLARRSSLALSSGDSPRGSLTRA